jgi:hypothetical protein
VLRHVVLCCAVRQTPELISVHELTHGSTEAILAMFMVRIGAAVLFAVLACGFASQRAPLGRPAVHSLEYL